MISYHIMSVCLYLRFYICDAVHRGSTFHPTGKVSEQVGLPSYRNTTVQLSTLYTYTISLKLPTPKISKSGIVMLSMLTMAISESGTGM